MLERLPWYWVQSLHRSIRRTFFTKGRPNANPLKVSATREQLLNAFGGRSYAPNWEFSYNYKGEDLNLARVEYVQDQEVHWMQVHVRGWNEGDHWELQAHYEPEPTEYPKAHLNGQPFSRKNGFEAIRSVLDRSGISYTKR